MNKAPEDSVAKVEYLLKSIPEIIHYQYFRIRQSGADTFVDVRIHVKQDLTN